MHCVASLAQVLQKAAQRPANQIRAACERKQKLTGEGGEVAKALGPSGPHQSTLMEAQATSLTHILADTPNDISVEGDQNRLMEVYKMHVGEEYDDEHDGGYDDGGGDEEEDG